MLLARLIVCVVAGSAALQVALPGARNPGDIIFERPERRAPAPGPVVLPELPPGADSITPLTIDVRMRRTPQKGRPRTARQTISRTRDRVHVVSGDREWLFERNTIDPRRVSGLLTDHPARTIVEHDESDLRNLLGVNGWADVLTLGSDEPADRRRPGVDSGLLRAPSLRFPAYRVVDAAEWLEGRR